MHATPTDCGIMESTAQRENMNDENGIVTDRFRKTINTTGGFFFMKSQTIFDFTISTYRKLKKKKTVKRAVKPKRLFNDFHM